MGYCGLATPGAGDYTGKEGDRAEQGLAHRVVMQLVDDVRLQGKGYVIFTDNFYSSPALFRDLTEKGFGGVGTARKDRREIPLSIRDARLRKGETVSSSDDGILAMKWRDKRDVTMLSTYHYDNMVTKSRRSRAAEGGVEDTEKPQVVEDYNQHMGGVDQSEQTLYYPLVTIFCHSAFKAIYHFVYFIGMT